MSMGDWFVAAMIALDVGATVGYALKRQYPLALFWFAIGVGNAALLWNSVRKG